MSSFAVLMVCTANYCRSPIAEQLLSAAAARHFGARNTWQVSSAGTDASFVSPMHEFSAQALLDRAALVDGHRTRQLDGDMLREADLVLTATREHRSAVVRRLPAAIGRTFTMLQFARLSDAVEPLTADDPGELGRRLVAEAKAARGMLQPVPPEQDDLADPMGRPLAEFQACADRLDAVVRSMMRPLPVLDAAAR